MKCISTLDLKTGGSLKVKRCTLVITSCEASLNSIGKIEEEQASSDHVTIRKVDDLENENRLAEAPQNSDNGEGF